MPSRRLPSSGLYVASLIPVFLRRVNGEPFHPGPFPLNRRGPVIGWIAAAWVTLSCIILLSPQFSPINVGPFNDAPLAVAGAVN
ncbi:MAG TPA: hypothetical protein VNF08_03555 [Acidimicrobiales bacterium]|nr:hypothetical protein [Acidimicrobiales bacterium]